MHRKISPMVTPCANVAQRRGSVYFGMKCRDDIGKAGESCQNGESRRAARPARRAFRAGIGPESGASTVSSDITPALPWWLRAGYLTVGE